MKKNKMVVLLIAIFIFIVTCSLYTKTYAAGSFEVSASLSSINVGDTITVYIKGNNAYGKVNISANNATLSAYSVFLQNDTKTVNLTAKSAGTITVSVTPASEGLGDIEENPITGTKTIKITVKAPSTGGNQGGSTGGNNGGSSGGNSGGTTTVTEPKFTSANKTVYATGDINLRSSWSTSSSATKISKGTELKLTGTSSQRVNGYVWYRVTYNGQTKYVSRDLVTETKPEEKEEKSNNTNLQSLSIEGVELTPAFSANVTEYTAKLTNYKEQSLRINAEAEDSKATVKVEGNEEIKIGENIISITVTAEDGTTKVYKITVTNEEKEGLGLSSLVIKGAELKDFSPSKFNYEIEFKELDQLQIEAIANEEGATVEIIGNENLTELGEHIITIMVTSADGEQIATYTITANKLAVEEAKKELNMKSILICALIALVVLVAIVILIVRYVKGNSSAEIDYVYNDNLENSEEENKEEVKETEINTNKEVETKEKEAKQEETETQKEISETKKDKKPTVDDLYADYDDEPTKKRGKGRHSK